MARPKIKQPGRPQVLSPAGRPVEMRGVRSTNVAAIGYLASKKWLYVRFKNNSTYVYYSVPKDEFVAFASASSKGEYHYWSIRDSYDYDRIS